KITPEGGALTHAYPDAAYHQEPPASIPYARSHASRALSAYASGHDAAGTAAIDSGSADRRSDYAGPGDPCPRGRGFCEARHSPSARAVWGAWGPKGLADPQCGAPGRDPPHSGDPLSAPGPAQTARTATLHAGRLWGRVLPGVGGPG